MNNTPPTQASTPTNNNSNSSNNSNTSGNTEEPKGKRKGAAEYELYDRIKVIGEGSYGKAILVQGRSDKKMWIIKSISIESMAPEEKIQAAREASILAHFNHPNIVKFREIYKTRGQKLCIVMEYADGGDLESKIDEASAQNKHFNEEQILDWFTQICLALKHVHDRKILHRDLKGQNIFLTSSGIVKLGDFGISRALDHTSEKAKTMAGTPYFLSPEIVNNQPYSFKSDIWALGVMLYKMCTLKHPFNGQNLNILALNIARGEFPPIPRFYSSQMRNLVSSLLSVRFEDRPYIKQILAYPIIRNRIRTLLTETVRIDEFSHTILHNQVVNLDVDLKTDWVPMLQKQVSSKEESVEQKPAKNPQSSQQQPPALVKKNSSNSLGNEKVLPSKENSGAVKNQQPSVRGKSKEGGYRKVENTKPVQKPAVGSAAKGMVSQPSNPKLLSKDPSKNIIPRPTTSSSTKPNAVNNKVELQKQPSAPVGGAKKAGEVNRPPSASKDVPKKFGSNPSSSKEIPAQPEVARAKVVVETKPLPTKEELLVKAQRESEIESQKIAQELMYEERQRERQKKEREKFLLEQMAEIPQNPQTPCEADVVEPENNNPILATQLIDKSHIDTSNIDVNKMLDELESIISQQISEDDDVIPHNIIQTSEITTVVSQNSDQVLREQEFDYEDFDFTKE